MSGVVVGVDGSAAADVALRWALRAAAARAVPLTAVQAFHVPALRGPLDREIDLEDARAAARARVAETFERAGRALADVPTTVDAIAVTDRRSVAHALLRRAGRCDLLVVGARGLGGFAGLLVGSVSQQVAAHATVPVAVVPDRRTSGGVDISAIVVGVDGSAPATTALRWAVRAAEVHACPVSAVVVLPSPTATLTSDVLRGLDRAAVDALWVHGAAEAHHALDELVDKVTVDTDVVVDRVVAQGDAGHELLRRAAGTDLLVVGSRGRGGFAGLLLGSVSQRCVQHTRGPVVVVHPDEPRTAAGRAR